MRSHFQLFALMFCCASLLVQQSESVTPIWVVGSSTTVSLGGLIAGGLLLKAGAAAIFGLVSVSTKRLIFHHYFTLIKYFNYHIKLIVLHDLHVSACIKGSQRKTRNI